MNMILKKQLAGSERRKGFTLVEVIVVLVILAILAAIAIPALTGYIDKAEDKKYIADARNVAVAVRTLLNDDYVNGTFDSTTTASAYVANGRPDWFNNYTVKCYQTGVLSTYATGTASDAKPDYMLYNREASKLTGITYTTTTGPGVWEIRYFAPKVPPSYTVFNAPAFVYFYYPEGSSSSGSGLPLIVVTYGLVTDPSKNTYSAFSNPSNFTLDPDAGYKVLHLKL
ncbi:MAG: prepilin-type N-terminal cleavage/methylation domain-containing protein [Clostridiales Family XIII bacterium]|nr:prepilin-type N-terminal cleavage/methylation domain-containing protein [Clostridiales Family XIII bacterium]